MKYYHLALITALICILTLTGCTSEDAEGIGYVKLHVDADKHRVLNVAWPVKGWDGVNKDYVDQQIADVNAGIYWDDLSVSMANARLPAALSPTFTSYKGCEVPAFSNTATNTLYFSAQLSHSYIEGTDIEFHIHLAYPDATAGNSTWQLTYSWADIGDTFPAETTILQIIEAPGIADYHQRAPVAETITGSSKGISSVLLCSITRFGGQERDSYDNDVYLVSCDFHYQTDGHGSESENTK